MFSIKQLGYRKAAALALLGASALALTATSGAFQKAAVGTPIAVTTVVQFNIYLPVKDRAGVDALIEEQQTPGSPAYHHYLTPAQFHEQFGPSAALVSAIEKELSAKGLKVLQVQTHSVTVSGTVGAVNAAFDTTLAAAHYPGGAQGMLALKPLKLTPNLQAAGGMIPAFEGVIHMHTFAQKVASSPGPVTNPLNRESSTGGYWFDDLKQAYAYPSYQKLTGKGVTIGILMTPNYNPPDMKLYFSHEKLAVPKISTFNVEGGAPYDPNEAAETHIDITHSAGMAPKASVILYNMPDLEDDSIFAALTDIVEINNVDVVNMSFGEPEVGLRTGVQRWNELQRHHRYLR